MKIKYLEDGVDLVINNVTYSLFAWYTLEYTRWYSFDVRTESLENSRRTKSRDRFISWIEEVAKDRQLSQHITLYIDRKFKQHLEMSRRYSFEND